MKNFDSDGVGAYNIACKGILILKTIKKNQNDDQKNLDLYITKEKWDKFVQSQWNSLFKSQK